jgi:hypothetical protein
MSDLPQLVGCDGQQPNATKCSNDKQYYFSANSFKQIDDDHKEYKKRQELFEYGVDTQCSEAGCGTQASLIDGKTKCYICGESILSSKGHFRNNPDGSQCEHVLTATTIAMLCGLSNSAYTNMIDEIGNSVLILQGNTLVRGFMTFRNRLIRNGIDGTTDSGEGGGKKGIVYKWSHPACNLIKNEYPFIRIDFTEDGPKIIDNVGCNSVQYVLQMLWTSKDDHRAIEWRKRFDTFNNPNGEEYCYDDETKLWIDNREKIIKADILDPIKKILGESTQNELSLFNGISMHILCEIITSKLLSSKTFQTSKIGLSLQLKKNFKKILHKTYKKIPGSLTKYLQSRDNSPFTMIKGAIKRRFIKQKGGRTRKRTDTRLIRKVISPHTPRETIQVPLSTENFYRDDYEVTELIGTMNNKIEVEGSFNYRDVLDIYKILEMGFNESVHELLLVNGTAAPVEIISFQHKHNQDIFKFFVSNLEEELSIIGAEDELPLTNRRINWERVNGRLERISDTIDEDEDKLLDEIFNYVNLLFMIDKKMEKEVSNMLDYKPYVSLTELIDDELVRDTLMSNIESITDADPLIVNDIDMDQVGKIKKKKKKKKKKKTTKKKPSKKKSSKKKPTKKKSSKKKKAKKKKKTSKKKSY